MFKTLIGLLAAVLIAPAALAQGSYRIQPGDVLQMEVLEDPALNRSLLVLPDGSVSVPLAGSVQASGQSIDGLRAAISDRIASNFAAKPTVFLSVNQLAAPKAATGTGTGPTISVFAMGEVTNPGKVSVSPGTTLLQFLAQSGGLTRFAATKRIQLRRTDAKTGMETVYNYNYKAVQDGASAPAIVLKSGDIVVVPERKLFE
ncbi:MAG: polysaccharide biosynthesis/export family protein [Pseudomonadota bacterium]